MFLYLTMTGYYSHGTPLHKIISEAFDVTKFQNEKDINT